MVLSVGIYQFLAVLKIHVLRLNVLRINNRHYSGSAEIGIYSGPLSQTMRETPMGRRLCQNYKKGYI